MFIRKNEGKLCVFIVYVDDIVLTGNDTVEMGRIKGSLATEFEMKDLGALRFFWALKLSVHQMESFFLNINMS
jgi:Reverse transcriptase (RNA-dependent DNA polymerase)